METLVFRKGLDRKAEVAGALVEDYHSSVVEQIRESGFVRSDGRLTLHLAREFGFCYGVDRAVDYAYQTRHRFPDRRVFLTGEIIHNPHVNEKLRAAGIRFLTDPGESWDELMANDVVIVPAFGVPVEQAARLTKQRCVTVDTTCGSVLNVWKNVTRYSRDSFTSVIHGKVHHEETRATASQALTSENGRYLIVLDRDEAGAVCEYIRSGVGAEALLSRFEGAVSSGFDPTRDLVRVGLANQTTMLMSESLEVEDLFRRAISDRYGPAVLSDHFRAFDTICSATQDRQDAVVQLLDQHRLDLMLVIGGYNSSNTINLARLCASRVPTYHVADPDCLSSADAIVHRPSSTPASPTHGAPGSSAVTQRGWLPSGPVVIGLTAGASTPNNVVGQTIERVIQLTSSTVSRPAAVDDVGAR